MCMCMVTFVYGRWTCLQQAVMCSRFKENKMDVICGLCSLATLYAGQQRAVLCICVILLSDRPHLLGGAAKEEDRNV